MARAWITDRWTRSPVDRHGNPQDPKTKDHGKGARWRVDWYELQPDGTRKLRGKSLRTKPLAEDFLAKIEHDIRSGVFQSAEGARKTVQEASAGWLTAKRRVKHSTRNAYRRDLDTWVLPAWGGRKLATIKRAEVEAWVTALLDGTAPREYKIEFADEAERGKLGPSRVRRLYNVLSSVLKYSVKHGWILTNAAAGVELPEIEDTEQVFLTIEELESLADAAELASDRALILTLGYVGLRIGEAAALRVCDVDLKTRRATIRATVTEDEHGKATIGTPKTGRTRVVPLTRFLVKILRPLIAEQDPEMFVFRSPRGAGINVHNWRARQWRDAVAGAGLDEIGLTPHKLRHTAASMAIAAGADVKLVQTMLGHKDATETLNTYGHLWPDRLDEVTTRLEKARRKALAPKSS